MSNKRIDQLPDIFYTPDGSELIPVRQAGNTCKWSLSALAQWIVVNSHINRPPIATEKTAGVLDSAASISGNMLTGDYDPDGDAMVLAISYNGTSQSVGVSFQTTYGTFYVDNTGAYTFVIGPGAKALGNGQVANEIIQYTLSDNKGGMAVSHLTITITGTNSVPIVESVTTGTPVNVVLTGNLLDHYAFDWEPTPGLSISSYTVETIAGTHAAGSSTTITGIGTIMIQANGIYSFTPVTDYTGPVPRIRYTVTDGANNVTAFLSISVNPLISVNGPTVLFTDIVSGPVGTGDGQSAYLRIFGKNFGVTADLGTNTKVFIGGVEVEHYYHITNSRTYSKNGIVRLCVRVGALTGLTLGEPYPIVVQVNGISSNANCTFIPNPGKIWYISRAGSDGTAVAGDITKPGRNYELADRTGMLHKMVPGDMLVDIGDDTFSDTGFETCLVKFYDEIGSVPTGIAGTGWYAFVAHPDHQPHYSCPPGASGGFHGPSSSRSGLAGEFWAVSGYVMDVQGGALQNAGPINGEYTGGHIRVVDCELGPWIVGSSPVLNCAGVAGAGEWVYVLGNYIHDIGGTSDLQNHGIYADTSAYGWTIRYNWITRCTGGSLIQCNDAEAGAGKLSTPTGIWQGFTNFDIAYNWLEESAKYGITFSDMGSNAGDLSAKIYNNMIIGTGGPPLRLATTSLTSDVTYAFNTVYDCMRQFSGTGNGYFRNEGLQGANHTVRVYNNILAFGPNTVAGTVWMYDYSGQSSGYDFERNLYWGNGQTVANPSSDSSAISGNPLFTNAAGGDFSLQSGSPAANAGTQPLPAGFSVVDDFTGIASRQFGGAPDIGAFEIPQVTPYLISAPTYSGGPQVGVATTTTVGTWGNSPTSYSRQYKVNGVNSGSAISGTGTASYTSAAGDAGGLLTCVVTATNANGSTSVTLTIGTIAVGAGGPAFTAPPTVSGTPQVGNVATANPGTTTGTVDSTSYQWLRNGSQISGATGTTYTWVDADAGTQTSVMETAVNATAGNATSTSASVGPVVGPPADPTHVGTTGDIFRSDVDKSVTRTAVTAGHYLVIFGYTPTGGNLNSISDNRSGSLSGVVSSYSNVTYGARFFHVVVHDTVGGDYTVTVNNATDGQLWIVELATCDAAAFLDMPVQRYIGDRYVTDHTFNVGPTTKGTDLLLAFWGCGVNGGTPGTFTAGDATDTAWTKESTDLASAPGGAMVEIRKLSAVGTYPVSATLSDGYCYPGAECMCLVVKGS